MQATHCYIVTGASKGLGKALVERLTENTKNLVIGIARSPMEARPQFIGLELDLADYEAILMNRAAIFPKGPFDRVCLINNAGWIGDIAHNGYIDPEAISRIHRVNVIAPALLMNEFMNQYDRLRGEKLVINISSGAAGKVMDGWSGYGASKAALNQMTRIAQYESDLKNRGFALYALSPGIIDTPMQETIRSASEDSFTNLEKFKSFKSDGSLRSPDDIAEKVMYLVEHFRDFPEVLQDVRKF
ncbi:SDR family NAD(P)-dependent oxidoreductase [Cyclobacterium xiamenense]|jgi:benzil reductase ((S)-benzoin forming)|uniref:SDR family NAD(P)-dependent oxidoreductase n=1 Tax=Cyclobacterium xiamenense TaxID=1297121 RepID=UPI0035CF2CAB